LASTEAQTEKMLSEKDVTPENVEEMYGVKSVDLSDVPTAKEMAMFGAEVAPVTGDAIALYNLPEDLRKAYELVKEGYSEGDIKDMGLGAGYAALTAAGVVPGLGMGARALRKGLRASFDDAVEQTGDLFRTASGMDDTSGLITVTDESVKITKPPKSVQKGPTTFKFFGGDKGISSDQKYTDYASSKKKADEQSFDTDTDKEEFIFRDSKGTYVDPADNKFRYEIGTTDLKLSDAIQERAVDISGPTVAGSFFKLSKEKDYVMLDDVLQESEVFKEYPVLRGIEVKKLPYDLSDRTDAFYAPFERAIYINPIRKKDEFLSILAHEMQHVIDFFEDRDYGADLDRFIESELIGRNLFKPDVDAPVGYDAAIDAYDNLDEDLQKSIYNAAFARYSAIGGEVDARNVEHRLKNPELQFDELPTRFRDEQAPEGKIADPAMDKQVMSAQKRQDKTSEAIPVIPVNQASLTKKGFDFKPGGEYVNPITKEILTGKKVGNANIKIVPGMEVKGGRPMASFNVTDLDVPEVGTTGKGKSQILVNLIKPTKKGNKAGWKWDNVGDEELEGVNTLVSVVHKGKHYFTLETDFSKGAELKTYPKSKSEPRLRPTATGELDLQEEIGKIRMKDKIHPVYRKITAFASGGLAMAKGGALPMDRQMSMFEDGGLMDEGGTIDPVSGNDVPPGSTQEEVRDDIPAQLSEGEFVFPADVVRYIGLGNLMRMRQEAKMGLKLMEQMGQMGNSEEATMPDDLPFDINDLDMEDEIDDNSSQEFAQGGVVYAQDGALIPSAYGTQTAQQPYQGYNPYQAAAATAADPIEAASAQYQAPQQSYTPTNIYKQEDIPTFKQFVGENVPNIDFELVEYRNAEGNSIMIKISKATGQPVQGEVIPEGYTKYDPEKTKTEDVMTGAVTPETTMVMDSGKMSREEIEAQRKADAEKAIRVKSRIAAANELGYTEFTSPFSGVGGMLASLVIPGGTMLAGAKGVGAKGQKGMLTGMGYVLDGEGGMFDPTTGHKVPTGLISALRDDFTYRGLSDFAKNQLKTDAALKEEFGAELYSKMVDNAIDKKFAKYEEDNVSMGDSNYIKEVKEAVKDEAKKGNVNTKGKIINPFEAQQGLGQYDPSKDLKVQRDAEAAAAKAAAERAKYRPASGGGGPAAGGGFGGYAPGGGGGGGSAATGGGGGAPSGPGSSDVGGQNRGYRAKGGLMEKEKPKTKKMKKGGLASKK